MINRVSKSKGINLRQESNKNSLLGKEFETNTCGKCFVIDYKSEKEVTVMFYEPFYIARCKLGNLKRGTVKNPYKPLIHGVGWFGQGKYTTKNFKFGYEIWKGLLARVYSDELPTYKDVTVCDEWLDFQNFAGWCETQEFFGAKDKRGKSYDLDKDLLVKGNKVYSPDTCCFIPHEVNQIFRSTLSFRGDNAVGVIYRPKIRKFVARLSKWGKLFHLGQRETEEEAFLLYKKEKEAYLQQVSEKWKGLVDDKVCQALMCYKVEIDD